jgi:hypothetical protein
MDGDITKTATATTTATPHKVIPSYLLTLGFIKGMI